MISEEERLARALASQFYEGFNEGYCSAIGVQWHGSIENLVSRHWRAFLPPARKFLDFRGGEE